MQRRAAALYVVFFLLVGLASLGLNGAAEKPHLSFEDPEYSLGEGDQLTVGGTEFSVDSIDAEVESGGGGGHGGGGGATLVRSGTLAYTETGIRETETWSNGSTVTYQNDSWVVVVENAEDPTSLTLREAINRTAILQNDSTVQNEVTTLDGTEYVVREDGDERTLIPADDYFPEPATETLSENDAIQFDGREVTIDSITGDGATLAWTISEEQTVDVSNKANVTLPTADGEVTYFAYFPDNSTLVLTQQFDVYADHQEATKRFHDHENGLWGVTILSGVASVLLIGLAYLPSRY
jgi:hypothetical protein